MEAKSTQQLIYEELSLEVTIEQAELLLRHLALVIDKNKSLNLTGISDFEKGVYLHVIDSLAALPELESAPKGRFLDIGTGAGFPGIPLGIASAREGLLIDSIAKKVLVVKQVIDALELGNLQAEAIRSEELAGREPSNFSAAVSRAVANIGVLMELASPLLESDGILVAMKGPVKEEEIEQAKAYAKPTGMQVERIREISIWNNEFQRSIVTIRKVEEPQMRLPRKAGMAVKRPLCR